MGDVMLVSSEKKEIGKTIIAIKTAIELSGKGKNVLLLDLSSGKRKISEYLNISENIIYDIKDVLDGTCSYEQAVINFQDNLSILPYPRVANKLGEIKRESFFELISAVKDEYDVTIIDADNLTSGHYLDFENINRVVIIDNNDFSAVKDINTELHILEKFGLKNSMVILNKYDKKSANKGFMITHKEIMKLIERDISGVIDENIKYDKADSYFLFSEEKNSFNDAVGKIINNL